MKILVLPMIVALLSGCGASADASADTQTESLTVTDRPLNVPSDFVFTPGGWSHPSCIHEVPSGATIDVDHGDVRVDGKLIAHYEPCKHKPVRGDRVSLKAPSGPGFSGWVEYTYQFPPVGSNQWGVVQDVMWVPSAPVQTGATLYFFPALMSTVDSDCGILQPVLQWGSSPAGGGNYWAIAAWWWGNTNQFHSGLTQVQTGDNIQSTMAHLSNGWFVLANDFARPAAQSILVNTACRFNQAFPAFFEVDNSFPINNCSQVPAGFARFTNIALGTGVGSFTNVPYSPTNVVNVPSSAPQCGWGVASNLAYPPSTTLSL